MQANSNSLVKVHPVHPEAFFDSIGFLRSWLTADPMPEDWTGIAKRGDIFFEVGRDGAERTFTALKGSKLQEAIADAEQRRASNSQYRVIEAKIGERTTIENWPSNDIAGLFRALDEWTLDPSMQMSGDDPTHPHVAFEAPYRSLAWGACISERIPGSDGWTERFIGTVPIHDQHPEAVRYCGNFLHYSFCFSLDTDDKALIAELDRRIAENMQRPEFQEARNRRLKRRA